LGVLGYLIERAEQAAIRLTGKIEGSTVFLSLVVEPAEVVYATKQGQSEESLTELQEMAALSDCHILPVYEETFIVGFELQLPVIHHTVLVIDDNEDVLQLFQGYLNSHGYRVVTAQTAQEAIDRAHQFQPYAITLDLMMPEHDGWELLQILLTQPDTSDIPIIVCTVLKQKELALSLGATAYLEKPVTKQALLSALEALAER
jgi:CheY-like chemotaxis protein